MNETAVYGLGSAIRGALRGYARPDCIVYDAAGKPVAVIDGETRERRPVGNA